MKHSLSLYSHVKENAELSTAELLAQLPVCATAAVIVDLDAVTHNYHYLQKIVGPQVVVASVLKANAYGYAAALLGRTLEQAGCRDFFVATTEEGIELREALQEPGRIYVLNGLLPGAASLFKEYDLTPVLNDLEQVKEWANFCRTQRSKLPCFLHVDTGMNRLGIEDKDAFYLANASELREHLNITCIMSHLAIAQAVDNPFNTEQRRRFERLIALFPGVRTSLSATAGVFMPADDFHYSLVRPGAGLYGFCPPSLIKAHPQFKPALHIMVRIVQMRQATTGEIVGYDATYHMPTDGRIAVLGAGYADGFSRTLSNSGVCYIDGHRAPIVGRVSMDLMTLNVSDLPENLCYRGKWVDVVTDAPSMWALAEAADTNVHDMLTRLGRRFYRIYKGGV